MRPSNGIGIFVCACLCACAAHAADLRKCSGDGGNSYVNGNCPPGTRELWVRRIEAEPAPAASEPSRQRDRTPRHAAQQRHSNGRGRSGSASKPSQGQTCEAAKRRRDEVRDRDWYTITYEQLSALDERVARACR